jgi:hypothetical protein
VLSRPPHPTQGNRDLASSSFRPRPIVLAAMPVACDTAAIPPYPAAVASVAASKRRSRSFRDGDRAEKRFRIGAGSIMPR